MFFLGAFLCLAFAATPSSALVEKQQTYVVHVNKARIGVSDRFEADAKQAYQSLMDSVSNFSSREQDEEEQESLLPEIIYVYEAAMSGFAAKLTPKQLERLKCTDGFVSAFPDEMLSLHTTHSAQFLGLELGNGLWSESSLASDVIVGIVDTGIWPEHVSFRDLNFPPVPSRWRGTCEEGTNFTSSNCNKKLVGARAFYKGYEAIVGRINETEDCRSPRDVNGHGSHTASTAAGNPVPKANLYGLAKGIASGMRFTSRIAVYKTCWRYGCAGTDVIAAIDQAVKDGVDVLSLSLGGSSRPFYIDPIAIASFRAADRGVFVSCSAGNSGPMKSTVSNGAPWLMTVGASYTDRTFLAIIKLGNGKKFIGSSFHTGKRIKKLPLVFNHTAGGTGAAFCLKNSLQKELVQGKIVICLRGENGRTEKGENVKANGGAAMIMVNPDAGDEELLTDAHVLPAASLGASAWKSIRQYLSRSNNPVASVHFRGTAYGTSAPVVAGFSSRGPSVAGQELLKPDVTAPGMNILAAWSPLSSPSLLKQDTRRVKFNIVSGTSMSCPHVSGLATLIKSVHRDWSPASIKSALMTTAYTTDNKNHPIGDASNVTSPASPFAIGSGHVDPESASDPGLVYDITTMDYVNYLCSLNYTSERISLFTGRSYTCPTGIVLQAGDLNYPSFAVNFVSGNQSNPAVTFKRTVTNVGSSRCSYSVRVEEPSGVRVRVKPEVLSFRKLGERLNYKVSFVGLGKMNSGDSAFGALIWVSGIYRVRSPIAVTWE